MKTKKPGRKPTSSSKPTSVTASALSSEAAETSKSFNMSIPDIKRLLATFHEQGYGITLEMVDKNWKRKEEIISDIQHVWCQH